MKDQILRLGKNSLIYGLGTMITRFISLLLLPLFTFYLLPEDYGVIAMLTLMTMVAQPIFGLGLSAAIGPSYFEGNNPIRKSQTIWTAFLILVISAGVLISIAWIIPESLSMLLLQSREYGYFVSLTLTGCALSIPASVLQFRIKFEQKAKSFVIITLISTFVTLIVSVIAVVILHWGIEGMIIGQLIGQALTFLMFFTIFIKDTRFDYSKSIRDELLRLGAPMIPSFAFLFVLMHSNRYILQLLESLEQVGIYSIGFNFGMIMYVLVGAFTSAWYPFYMSYMEKQEEAKVLFGHIYIYYSIGFGILTLIFFISAKPIIMLMTQVAFHDAYKVVGFSALACYLIGIFSLQMPPVVYLKEMRYVTILQSITAVISIPLNIVLIFFYGFIGAGIGLASGYLIMAALLFAWNKKQQARYFKVSYNANAIAKFFFFSFIIINAILINRDWNVVAEIFFSLLMLSIVLLAGYYSILSSDRALIKRKLAQIIRYA